MNVLINRRTGILVVGILGILLGPWAARAQSNWGQVAGRVTDASTGTGLHGATVLVNGTNFGTATDEQGRYAFRVPVGRHVLRMSMVGYEARFDTVEVAAEQTVTRNAMLHVGTMGLDEVTVEETRAVGESGAHRLTPAHLAAGPAPIRDGFRLLKTLPGVASNNELSGEYSVRGGGYNENLVFINGYEVYRQFRVRKGEHEGLGPIHPGLVDRMTLHVGGFPVRYGGKLSSMLDVAYRVPEDEGIRGTAQASLLSQDVAVGAGTGRVGWQLGVRRASAAPFFGSGETKGAYDPLFLDVQGLFNVRITPRHTLEMLAIGSNNRFRLQPASRTTDYGNALFGLYTTVFAFTGSEAADQTTWLGGARLASRLGSRLHLEHRLSLYETTETERIDLRGVGVHYDVYVTSSGLINRTGRSSFWLAQTTDNRVRVRTLTAQSRAVLTGARHVTEAGWQLRRFGFDDRLNESEFQELRTDAEVVGADERFLEDPDHLVFGDPAEELLRRYRGAARLQAVQLGGYVQSTLDPLPQRNRLSLVVGLRTDYFSFNREWTVSPRLSAALNVAENLQVFGSLGRYHQAPSYLAFRGEPEPGQSIDDALNRDVKAQRAVQGSVGGEYFDPRTRLYFRAEAYYKHLDWLITYDVQNVRLSYSGENDAAGFAYGLDLRMSGEFVPGLEGWVSYSFMVARERLLPEFVTPVNEGLLRRPMDQRHSVALFLQDYLPRHPSWRVNLRYLFGSGFPYTPIATQLTESDTVRIQIPFRRNSAELPLYLRVDMGFSKEITWSRQAPDRPLKLILGVDLLNLFNATSAIRYDWVPDHSGVSQRVPLRLTPRMLNLSARLEF